MRQIAFTGPQILTTQQEHIVVAVLNSLPPPRDCQIITGGCVGLDTLVAATMHARHYTVHTVLPAILTKVDPDWALHCTTHERTPHGTSPSETYRLRNARMVGIADELIAFLKGGVTGRNGETMTYNLARKANKPTRVIML